MPQIDPDFQARSVSLRRQPYEQEDELNDPRSDSARYAGKKK